MKYIKYNESKAAITKLQNYCNDNLAYLLDAGHKIVVNDFHKVGGVDFYVLNILIISPFTHEDILYDLIPFLIFFKDEFDILPIKVYPSNTVVDSNVNIEFGYIGKGLEHVYYNIDDLINNTDDFKDLKDKEVVRVSIHINKKSDKLRYVHLKGYN